MGRMAVVSDPRAELVGGGTNAKYIKGEANANFPWVGVTPK